MKKIKMKYNSDLLWSHGNRQPQLQYPIAPGIDSGIGFSKFNNTEYIFDVNIDKNGFEYDITSGMFVFILVLYFYFFLFCFFFFRCICHLSTRSPLGALHTHCRHKSNNFLFCSCFFVFIMY